MKRLALLILLLSPPASAADAGSDVPEALQGVWGREGRCDVAADRLTIGPRTAGWGEGPFRPVVYYASEGAIHWDEEYEVDNFVAGQGSDVLVHDTQGFGMPGQEGYARCGADRARMPWPPRRPGPR